MSTYRCIPREDCAVKLGEDRSPALRQAWLQCTNRKGPAMESGHQQGTTAVIGGAPPAPRAVAERPDDQALLERLRDGDEHAFAALVRRHHAAMARVARAYVPTQAVAEEVVQEAWLGVLAGLDRFEGRSSLKTWIFRILVNRAKTRGMQERRTVVFSSLVGDGAEARERDRFCSLEELASPGWRQVHPPPSAELPEDRVVAGELRQRVQAAIDTLAPRQRTVITLRDVEGWPAAEICALLRLTDANQRVLLHRARSHVRAALEPYLADACPVR